jgi:RNA polymerase sigma factor (sigma-70 family)
MERWMGEVSAERWDAAQRAYRGKIRTFARNSVRQLPGYEVADVEQELLVVLWQCVEKYDPNRGASFNTLFQGSARNKIISLIRRYSTQSRKALVMSLDEEAVRTVIEDTLSTSSAEDIALMRILIGEAVTQLGPEVLSGNRTRARRRKSA